MPVLQHAQQTQSGGITEVIQVEKKPAEFDWLGGTAAYVSHRYGQRPHEGLALVKDGAVHQRHAAFDPHTESGVVSYCGKRAKQGLSAFAFLFRETAS